MNDLETFLMEPSFPVFVVLLMIAIAVMIFMGMCKEITRKDEQLHKARLKENNQRTLKEWEHGINHELKEQIRGKDLQIKSLRSRLGLQPKT